MKKIFLGNLPFETKHENIVTLIQDLGCNVRVDLPRDRRTGKTRGFAFLEFQEDANTAECIARLKSMKLKGRSLKVDNVHENKKRGGNRRDESHNERQ